MSTIFVCNECGNEATKWSGRCPACGGWNTFREMKGIESGGKKGKRKVDSTSEKPQPLTGEIEQETRILTGIGEFDLVLGGGIVPGMVVLLGGEPGIGKTTLMLQVAGRLAGESGTVLFVSGEESRRQVTMRCGRLGIRSESIYLFCTVDVDSVLREIQKMKPSLVFIDSIQAMNNTRSNGGAGSVTQLREATAMLTRMAKQEQIPVFLIGHVTKEGIVAGPRIIEHMVDTVLYFEKELRDHYKILRAVKNRFGSTNELGIFQMDAEGLHEVNNTAGLFLGHGGGGSAAGCILEGSRSFLVEVQALVTPASYGTPLRVALGFDPKRLALLLAVLEKYLALDLRQSDVFLNLAGGFRTTDPGLDAAVAAAVIASAQEMKLPPRTMYLGEIGLGGELRPVSRLEQRIAEAGKQGFDRIILPRMESGKDTDGIVVDGINQLYAALFD